jgi:hypothetical protein
LYAAGYRSVQPTKLMCQTGDNTPSPMVLHLLHANDTILARLEVRLRIVGGEERDVNVPRQSLRSGTEDVEAVLRETQQVVIDMPSRMNTYTYHGKR